MSNGLPWFPFYVDAWLLDDKVMEMTYAERGVYLHLLCLQWREGSISLALATLQRALSLPTDTLAVSVDLEAVLARCFPPHPTLKGRRANPRLLQIRAEQEDRLRAMSEGGRKGGLKGGLKGRGKPPSTEVDVEVDVDVPPPPRARDTGDVVALREAIPAGYHPALEAALRGAKHPEAVAASILALGPGGIHAQKGATWETVGHALQDWAASGEPFRARGLGIFVGTLLRAPAAASPWGMDQPPSDHPLEQLRRMREDAERQEAVA